MVEQTDYVFDLELGDANGKHSRERYLLNGDILWVCDKTDLL